MKKVLVKTRIIDDLKEKTLLEVIGSFDEEKNILYYQDINVKVCVIIGPKIIIERSNEEYQLSLIFENNMLHKTCYEIFNPKIELELEVNTICLIKKTSSLHTEYVLAMNHETVGEFILDIEWEEQL